MALYDYVYVDFEKVASLYSQLTGGVVEILERSTESSRSADNKRNYDFRVFKHDAGGTTVDKSLSRETIKPHHALLKELEETLRSEGYLVDLSEGYKSLRNSEFRQELKNTFCIKVSGRAVIEDYERMKGIADVFPEILKLVNKSKESNLLKSAEYIELKGRVREIKESLQEVKDRNIRAKKQSDLKAIETTLAGMISGATLSGVDQWVLDGMKTWIDAFLPGIVNLRIYPSVEKPDEHVFGHLKKRCFEDPDTNSLHFTYGSFPTEQLTMLGVVTSIPGEGGEEFKPLGEFDKTKLIDHEAVEKAFRGLFRGFDGLEQMIRTSRFPRVLVYPLTVYRSVDRIRKE